VRGMNLGAAATLLRRIGVMCATLYAPRSYLSSSGSEWQPEVIENPMALGNEITAEVRTGSNPGVEHPSRVREEWSLGT